MTVTFPWGLNTASGKTGAKAYFKEIAQGRYIIEPRLEGTEKLLYPFRPAAIELDLTTQNRFSQVFGVVR